MLNQEDNHATSTLSAIVVLVFQTSSARACYLRNKHQSHNPTQMTDPDDVCSLCVMYVCVVDARYRKQSTRQHNTKIMLVPYK